jgi:hypothetical protein
MNITIDKICFRWYGLFTKTKEIGHGYQDQGVVVTFQRKNVDLAF